MGLGPQSRCASHLTRFLLSNVFFSHRLSYNSCWGQYFSECCLINTELPRYLHYVPKMYLFAAECFKILLPFSMRCYHRCTDFTIKRLVLARTDNKVSIVSWKTATTVLQWTLHSQYFRSTRLIEMRSVSNIHPWKKKIKLSNSWLGGVLWNIWQHFLKLSSWFSTILWVGWGGKLFSTVDKNFAVVFYVWWNSDPMPF